MVLAGIGIVSVDVPEAAAGPRLPTVPVNVAVCPGATDCAGATKVKNKSACAAPATTSAPLLGAAVLLLKFGSELLLVVEAEAVICVPFAVPAATAKLTGIAAEVPAARFGLVQTTLPLVAPTAGVAQVQPFGTVPTD